MKRFEDLVIVEVAGSIAGAYCGKLFADHGAEVILVGTSSLPAAAAGYLHEMKTAVPELSDRLLARADVVIVSAANDRPPRRDVGDGPVRLRISPFGESGPYARWRGSDLVDYAIGGHLYLYGDPNREPLHGPPNQPAFASGLFGFVGVMSALWARERSGLSQDVEVSHTDVMVALHQFTLLRYTLGGDVLRRMGNRFTGQGHPNGIYPCRDGWISIAAPSEEQVQRLLAVSGLDHLLDRPDIASAMDFQTKPEVLNDALLPWLAEQAVDELVELLQAVRVPAAPTTTMAGVLADPHLAERDYWRSTATGHRVPGPPFRLSSHRWRSDRLYPDEGGGPQLDVGVGGGRDDGGPGPRPAQVEELASDGPLSGLRVLDLTRVWAGPLASRMLAELGADVVWVEAPWARGPRRLPDSLVSTVKYFPGNDQGEAQWNRNGHLVKYALGKRSLALDLSADGGVATFERLVPWADVVIENYSSRVMPQFGLDEHRLHELNPDLIYVTMPGYGRSGPAEHWLAFGSSVDSHAGLSSLIGYADQVPWKGGIAWPDPIAGLHAASGLLIALWDRACGAGTRDGPSAGATVEVAQFESIVAVLGDQLLASQLDGADQVAAGPGNRSPDHAPQGVYPCRGDDRWVAVTVLDDAGWAALCDLAELDHRYWSMTVDERRSAHDDIDRVLAGWTVGQDQREVAGLLQTHGIAAGPVLDAPGLLADPHLRERQVFVEVDQPTIGPFATARLPIRLSHTPMKVRRPAPRLGEHNAEVLGDAAGLTADEIEQLAASGVIADRPPN